VTAVRLQRWPEDVVMLELPFKPAEAFVGYASYRHGVGRALSTTSSRIHGGSS